MTKKETEQRIKLRLYMNPIRHDAVIIEWASDGSNMLVRFDGPLPDTRLYVWSDSHLVDKDPVVKSATPEFPAEKRMPEGAQIWVVL